MSFVHDLVIRGGTVVDGSGGEPRTGDVAIDADRVTAVGAVDGEAVPGTFAGEDELFAIGRVLVNP